MRSAVASPLSGLVAVAALLGATGCGNIDERPDPAYPRVPVGYNEPGTPHPAPQAAPTDGELAIGVDNETYSDADPSAVTTFRPVLEGHGDWVENADYGTVWVPSQAEVGPSFTPYVSAGHWAYDGGYVWVSDYSWGWVPFHYGRWAYSNGVGWVWVPGRRYAGAWVTWHVGPRGYGYVGWSPLAPSWVWHRGVPAMLVRPPAQRYVYCPTRALFHRRVNEHVVNTETAPTVAEPMRTYVPAQPAVGGDGDRVVASPGVDGARAVADPSVAGPAPRDLGLADSQVVGVPRDDQGLWRARQASQPRAGDANAVATNAAGRSYAAEAPVPREIPFPSRAHDAVARAPQYQGIEPRNLPPRLAAAEPLPPLSNQSRSAFDGRPSLFATHPTFSRPLITASPPGGSFSHSPSFAPSGPSFSSSTSFSSPGPSFRGAAISSPSPSPIVRSAPQGGFVGARPSVITATPSAAARGLRR